MLVIPNESPTLGKMNSYYVQIPRLIEHFQGEVGCGALHFKSSSSEGILFFDKDDILNGFANGRHGETTGRNVIVQLIQSTESTNYTLSVYQIRTEDIYFWSTIPNAKRIYQDLSTEFTDLVGLIKKMKTEALTGFIEVIISSQRERGLIMFNNGQICGGSYTWGPIDSLRHNQDLDRLIALTMDCGGVFHVSRVQTMKGAGKTIAEEYIPVEIPPGPSPQMLKAIEELMIVFEHTVVGGRRIDSDFTTLLNRKFVAKADKYPFLDPFAAEFKYADKKLTFLGDTTDHELVQGVIESIREIAREIDVHVVFSENLDTWARKHESEIDGFKIMI